MNIANALNMLANRRKTSGWADGADLAAAEGIPQDDFEARLRLHEALRARRDVSVTMGIGDEPTKYRLMA